MTRTIPSAKQMEDSRKTHYFRDDEGDRLIVITQLLPNGEYSAQIDDYEEDGPHGLGDTRLEALADLARAMVESITEDD
jgi:hypothetical protein